MTRIRVFQARWNVNNKQVISGTLKGEQHRNNFRSDVFTAAFTGKKLKFPARMGMIPSEAQGHG